MRIYTFLLTFLIAVVSAVAQPWTPVDENKYNDETVVYVRLSTGDANADNHPTLYTVGAFIDGECRATAKATLGDDGYYLYVVRVHGDHDTDMGKLISFVVYDSQNDFEFNTIPSRPVMFTGESEGTPSDCIILTFNGRYVALQGFIVNVESPCAWQTGQLVLTPVPADAVFHPENLSLDFSCFPTHWTAAEWEQDTTDPLVFNVTPLVPGEIVLTLNGGAIPLYDAYGKTFSSFSVAYPVRLNEGWQWMTNAYGDITTGDDFLQVYGGDALIEIRTHENLLYNDPEWGYFGTLLDAGLPQNTAYKVRMKTGPVLGRLWYGSRQRGMTFRVESGYSWIPSPYYYNRKFDTAFPITASLPEGFTIISKQGGQAEWNGESWTGDLPALMAGEYFICHNPSDRVFNLTYADEFVMPQGDEATAATPVGPWEFDASRFSDNMTMVATVVGLDCPADYVIGAFVGNECRGEGRWIDGRFFITAHVDGFDEVSLRLCHLPTDSQYAIDESFGVQLHLGSFTYPVQLHSTEFTTGITSATASDCQPAERYDIMGRRVTDSHHGLILIRTQGKTKKKVLR